MGCQEHQMAQAGECLMAQVNQEHCRTARDSAHGCNGPSVKPPKIYGVRSGCGACNARAVSNPILCAPGSMRVAGPHTLCLKCWK